MWFWQRQKILQSTEPQLLQLHTLWEYNDIDQENHHFISQAYIYPFPILSSDQSGLTWGKIFCLG